MNTNYLEQNSTLDRFSYIQNCPEKHPKAHINKGDMSKMWL